MRRLIPALCALVLAAAACKGDTPAAVPRTPGKPPTLQIIAAGLPLVKGLENAVRIGFRSASRFATVILNHQVGTRADVCPLSSPEAAVPASGCVTSVGRGVRETVGGGAGIGGIAIVYHDAPSTAEVRLEFDEGGREVSFRFPRLARPPGASVCKDNGCNPIFELMPVHDGPFKARASWTGGAGRLELQSGRVLARSFTATNVPYRIPAEDAGASPVEISTQMSEPAEYALAFLNASGAELSDIVIEATWP
jgi:hypothetical protein